MGIAKADDLRAVSKFLEQIDVDRTGVRCALCLCVYPCSCVLTYPPCGTRLDWIVSTQLITELEFISYFKGVRTGAPDTAVLNTVK